MSKFETHRAAADDAGTRLDVFLARVVDGVSRSLVSALVKDGRVLVNGRLEKPAYRLAPGDTVRVDLVMPPSLSAEPEDIPLRVVYEDADVAVIDKPAGLVVHPAPGHEGGTLANALTSRFPQTKQTGAEHRPGIVHRLDKDTSGLIAVALSPRGQASLQEQIAARTAGRVYLALAGGRVLPARGVIDAPVGRDPGDRKRMATHGASARPARTGYVVREYLPGWSYLEASLQTGRTHQIRVHFAALGHPLAGDVTYGGAAIPGLDRQFLHAHRLSFHSPSTGELLTFESELPGDLKGALDRARESGAG